MKGRASICRIDSRAVFEGNMIHNKKTAGAPAPAVFTWWAILDLNQWPPVCETGTLTN